MNADEELFEISLRIKNTEGQVKKVILEPWADEVKIAIGDELIVTGIGPKDDRPLEFELLPKTLVIYGWNRSRLSVCVNGVLVNTASALVPCL